MAMRQSSVHTKDEKSALLFFFFTRHPIQQPCRYRDIAEGGEGGEYVLTTYSEW